jgi:hypothetical protein
MRVILKSVMKIVKIVNKSSIYYNKIGVLLENDTLNNYPKLYNIKFINNIIKKFFDYEFKYIDEE